MAFSYLLTSILEPQDPEWNPIIEEFRTQFPNSSLFFTYGTAKKTTHRITWGIIFLFACVHLIRPNS
uniref:Uncharacterized protein n=1 Tax=Rhipiliopsis peltata TaxID=2320810 RepID=A0A386B1E4_9CHLO|nr:hypothetical protein Ycf47 [Rhipiliopsis peltata]AYC65519.1 hypothetical protein Ycf47 [Rhipiliopsis peltata]